MLKSVCVFVMMLFFIGCSALKKDDEKIARLHLEIGVAHLNEGNYPRGLKELIKANSLDPDNPVILNYLALGYFVREKYYESEKWLLRAIELKPEYMEARNNLGRVYVEMGKYDQAIKQLTMVLSDLTYSTPGKAQFNLATAYFRKGDYIQSRDTVQLVWKTNKFHCPSFILYGKTLYELKNYSESKTAFEKALLKCNQVGKKRPEIHYYSAMADYKLGRKQESLKQMQDIIKLYPDSSYAKRASVMLKVIAR